MNKHILVVSNANEPAGFGHLSRCLNIIANFTSQYPDYSFSFIGEYSEDALFMIQKCHIDQRIEKRLVGNIKDSCFLVDDYLMTQDVLDALTANNKVIVVDDFNLLDYKGCDLVINFRSKADSFQYSAKNSALGIGFFPAPLSFASIKKHQLEKTLTKVGNILVFIGGNDKDDIGLKVSKQLAVIFPAAIINFVSRLKINTRVAEFSNIKIHCVQPTLDELLFNADVVVSGGGLLKYESIYCAIPNYAINQTHEQEMDTNILDDQNLTVNLGMSDNYFNEIERVANDFKDLEGVKILRQKLASGIPENSGQKLSNKINIVINE